MVAGGGAERMASRIAAGTEARRAAGADEAVLAGRIRVQRNYEVGAEGERLVAAALAELPPSYRVWHDVRWPGRRQANIDHVVVAPGGVFVIDAKNYGARFRVGADGTPWCGRYPKTREVESCASQANAVAALLEPRHRLAVRGVLCLAAQDFPAAPVLGATVVGRSDIVRWLTTAPPVLDARDLLAVAGRLERDLRPAVAAPQASVPPQKSVSTARPGPPASGTVWKRRLVVGITAAATAGAALTAVVEAVWR